MATVPEGGWNALPPWQAPLLRTSPHTPPRSCLAARVAVKWPSSWRPHPLPSVTTSRCELPFRPFAQHWRSPFTIKFHRRQSLAISQCPSSAPPSAQLPPEPLTACSNPLQLQTEPFSSNSGRNAAASTSPWPALLRASLPLLSSFLKSR